MKFNKIIEIDIWSNFGCFNKPFSTSGGNLSYLIPPKTVIIGMIGAILGYDVNNFETIDKNNKKYEIEELFDIKISIQPLFDFKSKRVTFNKFFIDKKKIKFKNINQDILIEPYYKIFISFPDSLSDIEEVFINRLKNYESIFNLYMGKNEFFLNYELCNIIKYDSIFLNKNNISEYEDLRIFGFLSKEFINDVKINKVFQNQEFSFIFGSDITRLPPYYTYILKQYPIKRTNFSDFKYTDIYFFTSKKFKDCYFTKIIFNHQMDENQSLELTKIGENEWISMI